MSSSPYVSLCPRGDMGSCESLASYLSIKELQRLADVKQLKEVISYFLISDSRAAGRVGSLNTTEMLSVVGPAYYVTLQPKPTNVCRATTPSLINPLFSND